MDSWHSSRVRGFGRIVLALAFGLVGSACGQDDRDTRPQAPPEPAATAPSSPAPDTAANPAPPPAPAPDAPPLEFSFQYPGSVPDEAEYSNPSEFGKVYRTDDTPAQVQDYYREALSNAGWSMMAEKDEGEVSMSIYIKDDQMATIFYAQSEGGGTEVTAVVAGGLAQSGQGMAPRRWSPEGGS